MPQVTFLYDGKKKVVHDETGKTILQIALDHDIPMEHACGGNGFCTTCMCAVRGGMENLSPRNDREENMGITEDPWRLSCQTKVEGDITIEIPM
jgi:2Fe-2S ferredoxin